MDTWELLQIASFWIMESRILEFLKKFQEISVPIAFLISFVNLTDVELSLKLSFIVLTNLFSPH